MKPNPHDFSFGTASNNLQKTSSKTYKSFEIGHHHRSAPNIFQIFNKISDISNHQQINEAMLQAKDVKQRSQLLGMILHRKQELDDLNQFLQFHSVGNLLQKIKTKIMSRLVLIRERKENGSKPPLMKRLSLFSTGASPKAKRSAITDSSTHTINTINPSFELANIMQNPKALDMVVTLYKAMQKNKNKGLEIENQQQRGSKKGKLMTILESSTTYVKEYEQYQDFIKKHINIKTRQDIFNKIRLEHLKKMDQLKKAEKLKSAKKQLEEDLCRFLTKDEKNIKNDEIKEKITDFFEGGIRNEEIKKVEENAKIRLIKILKATQNQNKPKIDMEMSKKLQNITMPVKRNFVANNNRLKSPLLKKNMQSSTLLTHHHPGKKKRNFLKKNEGKEQNIRNFTEEDSLGSAYEYRLEGLYGEATQLNNKIRKMNVIREEKNLKNYKNELRQAESEIFITMNQISPLTSKFRPENFFSRSDHLKQLKFPKSSSHLIIIPSNSEGLGFLLNCYNDKVLSQKLDKNLFQSTILNANRICESVWKKKRMLEENDELFWLDYLMILAFVLLFLGVFLIIEYTEDLENGFLYAALVFFALGGALAVFVLAVNMIKKPRFIKLEETIYKRLRTYFEAENEGIYKEMSMYWIVQEKFFWLELHLEKTFKKYHVF